MRVAADGGGADEAHRRVLRGVLHAVQLLGAGVLEQGQVLHEEAIGLLGVGVVARGGERAADLEKQLARLAHLELPRRHPALGLPEVRLQHRKAPGGRRKVHEAKEDAEAVARAEWQHVVEVGEDAHAQVDLGGRVLAHHVARRLRHRRQRIALRAPCDVAKDGEDAFHISIARVREDGVALGQDARDKRLHVGFVDRLPNRARRRERTPPTTHRRLNV